MKLEVLIKSKDNKTLATIGVRPGENYQQVFTTPFTEDGVSLQGFKLQTFTSFATPQVQPTGDNRKAVKENAHLTLLAVANEIAACMKICGMEGDLYRRLDQAIRFSYVALTGQERP